MRKMEGKQMNNIIMSNELTKDYKEGRGIFDVHLSINEGEVFGLVGINGSGKTTLIRHLMGSLHPHRGNSTILDKDAWKYSGELKKHVSYIPGEISFPNVKTGWDFFKIQAEYMHLKSDEKTKELVERFALDPSAKLKRMSKGMKQKSAIVNAFMNDSKILILDEPTTGLDPLMQKVFTNLVLEEKKKGKTIFMSSHIFEELEQACDKVAFIKDGYIIDVVEIGKISGNESIKEYKIEFASKNDYEQFLSGTFNVIRKQDNYNQVSIKVSDDEINTLFEVISKLDIKFISQKPRTLEAYFKEKYIKEEV